MRSQLNHHDDSENLGSNKVMVAAIELGELDLA